jgi:hypothetical protein
MSHELVGLVTDELEKEYFAHDPQLRNVLDVLTQEE